ncbi:MAG: ferrochelatase [Rhizobacter sp.]|nr:ferrochelatase [Rhizobacter sp.]
MPAPVKVYKVSPPLPTSPPLPDKVAILLVNLGTPDEPTVPAVRRYLGQFLSDTRVVELPPLLWKIVLYGIILRIRPARSAEKYQSIWTPEGSPLKVETGKQARLLAGYLGERGQPVAVRYAMRYGSPGIPQTLDALNAEGFTRILVLPLYPQYAGSTTASSFDAVTNWAQKTRAMPEFRFVNRYHDDAGYIDALAASVAQHWVEHGKPDQLVMSFHGVPKRTILAGDPYRNQCLETARLLVRRLLLPEGSYRVTFQSRFLKGDWLEPYTEPTVRQLGRDGMQRIDVMCPGFPADCLETREEIAMEVRDAFLESGGKEFHYIPCLNTRHEWITALTAIAQKHLGGWA